jgi:dTDP-L-rhamnose 4-epimerase
LGDIRHNFADLAKIEKALGFQPKVSFTEGIKKFTDWVNGQQLGASKYEESIKEMHDKGLLK